MLFWSFLFLLIGVSATPFSLIGYLCADCPSAINPNTLVTAIHKSYSRVIFAFAGWDADGHLVNQWDSPSKKFTLTPAIVAALKKEGRSVFISLGGGAANSITPDLNSTTLAKELLALINTLGLDGVDLDLENFTGDIVGCMSRALDLVAQLHAGAPNLLFSAAPQMTDLYPGWPSISPGFNRYAPLLSQPHTALFDAIMPQMYNTWGQVETIEYAKSYAYALEQGFSIANGAYNVTVQPGQFYLGYPASPSGAGSGFLPPADVVAMGRALAANSTPIKGFMTWAIGWDQQNNWEFANAVANG